jgi:HAMP domain-containing protein/DNA-directed RNA polymerase subunit RPC12/RpoP
MHMTIICEQCGRQYYIDPKQITGKQYIITCESCNTKIIIPKSPDKTPRQGKKVANPAPPKSETWQPAPPPPAKTGIGLRGKMFFLFFFVPICLIIAGGILYLNYMKNLSGLITQESNQIVTKMAEQVIAEKGRSVAKEIERYMLTHPELKKNPPFAKEDYNNYSGFSSIAIQKVGTTGYTCLVAKHTESEPISKLWAHPIEKLIGVDIDAAMKKTLGENFQRWYDITVKAFKGKGQEAAGYYMWYDKREKYMVMVPVEGTDFFIASTTYLDEFTLPMTQLEQKAAAITVHARRSVMIILVVTALLVAFFVAIYSYQLSGRLRALADAADRISVGNLDVAIEATKSRDELGRLTQALNRMQNSIRLAIQRLRERKR